MRDSMEKGFTLIELLMVVAIITILAGGAIPNLLRARMSAQETGAIASCKTLAAAQTDYHTNTSPHTFALSLSFLGVGRSAGGVPYIDSVLASGVKNGYTFELVAGSELRILTKQGGRVQAFQSWSATAFPVAYGSSGVRTFYIDESGVIRGQDYGGLPGRINLPVLN